MRMQKYILGTWAMVYEFYGRILGLVQHRILKKGKAGDFFSVSPGRRFNGRKQ